VETIRKAASVDGLRCSSESQFSAVQFPAALIDLTSRGPLLRHAHISTPPSQHSPCCRPLNAYLMHGGNIALSLID
jgi:hypothetical protein